MNFVPLCHSTHPDHRKQHQVLSIFHLCSMKTRKRQKSKLRIIMNSMQYILTHMHIQQGVLKRCTQKNSTEPPKSNNSCVCTPYAYCGQCIFTDTGRLCLEFQLTASIVLAFTQTLCRYILTVCNPNRKAMYKLSVTLLYLQHVLVLPLLTGHILFHGSLSTLEDKIHYRFKDRQLLQVHG